MQSLFHCRMQEARLVAKIRSQEAALRRKAAEDSHLPVLETLRKLQAELSQKQLEIEKILNHELKRLVQELKK
ncbi:hypothetical protein [Mucilaginibacter agri]|uniref:Uncharacterized protein n=1 Tax=Mucilaginibacter agri TaxID=2695265 RepID=A0A965ZHQ6_9SPHI|nr:hypothetical protein [Mucilaginibacter agri]NCD70925.1 hypothetical protein [Mucilaginibacter agri]